MKLFRQNCESSFFFFQRLKEIIPSHSMWMWFINYQSFLITWYWHISNTLESLLSERIFSMIFLSRPFLSARRNNLMPALWYCLSDPVWLLERGVRVHRGWQKVSSKSYAKCFYASHWIASKPLKFEHFMTVFYFFCLVWVFLRLTFLVLR